MVDISVRWSRCRRSSFSRVAGRERIVLRSESTQNHASAYLLSVSDVVSTLAALALALRTRAENASRSCGVLSLSSREFCVDSSDYYGGCWAGVIIMIQGIG